MTRKRKLKRRVRERQARTGESYVTARRHVAAEPASSLVDITAQAAALGFRCGVAITAALAEQVEAVLALSRLRDELARPHANVATARMFSIAFGIRSPALAIAAADPEALEQFVAAVRAGATGASSDGSLLAIQAMGVTDVVPVICMLDAGAPLVLMRPGGKIRYEWSNGKGGGFYLTGEFIELVPFSRIVHVERMHMPDATPDNHVETRFEPDGTGTLMTMRMTLPDANTRAAMLASGMEQGMEASYARLEGVI